MVHMKASHNKWIRYKDQDGSVPISIVNSSTNKYILDHAKIIPNTQANRRMMDLRKRRTTDSGNLNFHFSCDGCCIYTH